VSEWKSSKKVETNLSIWKVLRSKKVEEGRLETVEMGVDEDDQVETVEMGVIEEGGQLETVETGVVRVETVETGVGKADDNGAICRIGSCQEERSEMLLLSDLPTDG
jgi:hypothetical protein